MNYPMNYQQNPYVMGTFKAESSLTFLARVILFILFLACLINVIGIWGGRMDLISWFTGFTVKDRDGLNLFLFYASSGSFFFVLAIRWYKAIWWMVVISGLIAFITNWGTVYERISNSSGPSATEVLSEKFDFSKIPTLKGTAIPAANGNTETTQPAMQLEPVTGSVTQGVTQVVSQNTPARQKAADAHQKAVDTHTDRMKQKGYTWSAHLNQDEKDWCANKAARAAYRLKYNRATAAQRTEEKLKPEWLVEARCVTNLLWVK